MNIDELMEKLDDAVWKSVELYQSEYEEISANIRKVLEQLREEGKI